MCGWFQFEFLFVQINPGDFTLAVLSQGALYCLLGAYSSASLASSRDWDCVGQVWPALVRCGLSPTVSLEKPSIGRLLDDVADRILRQHDTIGIYLTVSLLLKLLQLLPAFNRLHRPHAPNPTCRWARDVWRWPIVSRSPKTPPLVRGPLWRSWRRVCSVRGSGTWWRRGEGWRSPWCVRGVWSEILTRMLLLQQEVREAGQRPPGLPGGQRSVGLPSLRENVQE